MSFIVFVYTICNWLFSFHCQPGSQWHRTLIVNALMGRWFVNNLSIYSTPPQLPMTKNGPSWSWFYGSWINNYIVPVHVQSVPITTKVVSSNPVHGEVYSIQHYVIKFVSELRQAGGFLRVLRFPPPKKTKILLKVALNTINRTND